MRAGRVAFLGPEGTFTEEVLLAARLPGVEPVPLAAVDDCVEAVAAGDVARAVVPIENALEGSVNATLDALVREEDVAIVGEAVHPIEHCLVAAGPLALDAIEVVASHPQAHAQCHRFLRERLPRARLMAASSTAEAVRLAVSRGEVGWAAIGPRLAAARYGAEVLAAGLEDAPGNATRFVWLARAGDPWRLPGDGPAKTSLVFWGAGASEPGWLVRCLSEFAFRGVNLVRIESRPSREGLGRYRFFVDLEGSADADAVGGAIAALARHCERVRTLGCYPAAA